jgi:hypothetical protein
MRKAYFGGGPHPVDLKRHLLLAKDWSYDICSNLFVEIDSTQNSNIELLLADSCDLKTLFKLFIFEINSHFSKISFIALELFNLSFKAWFEELIFLIKETKSTSNLKSILYFALVIPIRILLVRVILSKGDREIIVPSELRINFLKSILSKNIVYILIRNKPILSDWNFKKYEEFNQLSIQAKDLIENGNFLFIAGRINAEEEFHQICKYAYYANLKIIAATSQFERMKKSIDQFPELILSLGTLSNSMVMYISSKCLAGICLYNNYTINQRLSASSKFFEFLLLNRPIISCDNIGMKREFKSEFIHLIIPLDKLNEGFRIKPEVIKLNKKFCYEYELKDLSL